jgi:hypothetical protein
VRCEKRAVLEALARRCPHLSALTQNKKQREAQTADVHTRNRGKMIVDWKWGVTNVQHTASDSGTVRRHGTTPDLIKGEVLCSPVCGFAGESRKRDGVGRMLFLMAVCCSPCRGERLLIITAIPLGVYG